MFWAIVTAQESAEQVSSWPGGNAEFAPEPLASGPTRHTVVYEPGRMRLEFDFDPRV